MRDYHRFFRAQLADWALAADNYASQESAVFEDLYFGDPSDASVPPRRLRKICLPKRIGSSSANITAKGQVDRPCFLCPHRLPPEQKGLPLEIGSCGEGFQLLVNPFPVFPEHFTLPALAHRPQEICAVLDTFLTLACEMDDMVLFYNGGQCGASAPDHLHFQAVPKGFLPLEADGCGEAFAVCDALGCRYWHLEAGFRPSADAMEDARWRMGRWLERLIGAFAQGWKERYGEDIDAENRINLLAWTTEAADGGRLVCLVFPRQKHRPDCFYKEEPDRLVTSPASVEMGGYYIFPRPEDFQKVKPGQIREIFAQVCLEKDLFDRLSLELRPDNSFLI